MLLALPVEFKCCGCEVADYDWWMPSTFRQKKHVLLCQHYSLTKIAICSYRVAIDLDGQDLFHCNDAMYPSI